MGEIRVRVADETSLYDPFDVSGLRLSDEFATYLEGRLAEEPPHGVVRLVFEGAPVDRARLASALAAKMDAYADDLARRRRHSVFASIRLLVIGVAFIALGLAVDGQVGAVVAAIISTIGSFSVWEAANLWIKELPSLRLRQRVLSILRGYELVIASTDDTPPAVASRM